MATNDFSEELNIAEPGNDNNSTIQNDDSSIDIPKKFLDPETNTLNVNTLLKSYMALEKHLSSKSNTDESLTNNTETDHSSDAHDYEILPEIDGSLKAIGLTRDQAEKIYELADDKLSTSLRELETERQLLQLEQHFGGTTNWSRISAELANWAESNLKPEVYTNLASNADGVIAMHHMMTSSEPTTVGSVDRSSGSLDEEALYELMRDPKYWRDHDPAIVSQVTHGFKQLFGS